MNRILVVDDKPTIVAQICRFLRKWNFETVGAGNLEDAEREMTAGDICVIIQDIILPSRGGDVFDFIQRHCGPGSPREAIAITAHLAEADMRRIVDAGVFCFFKKPLDLDELLVATWSAQQRAERALSGSRERHRSAG